MTTDTTEADGVSLCPWRGFERPHRHLSGASVRRIIEPRKMALR